MASFVANNALNKWANGDIDFGSDTFKCMLLDSGASPNKDTLDFRNDVEADEVPATGGYSAGGEAVTVTVSALDTANDRQEIVLGGFTISAPTTITARYAVYYKSRGGASSADEVIAVVDFGSDVISSGGDWSLTASTIRLQN